VNQWVDGCMVSLCRGMYRCVDGKRKECVVVGWLEGGSRNRWVDVTNKQVDNCVRGQISVLGDGRMYRGIPGWVK